MNILICYLCKLDQCWQPQLGNINCQDRYRILMASLIADCYQRHSSFCSHWIILKHFSGATETPEPGARGDRAGDWPTTGPGWADSSWMLKMICLGYLRSVSVVSAPPPTRRLGWSVAPMEKITKISVSWNRFHANSSEDKVVQNCTEMDGLDKQQNLNLQVEVFKVLNCLWRCRTVEHVGHLVLEWRLWDNFKHLGSGPPTLVS